MSEFQPRSVRCLVAGRVQGVFYRATAARRAEQAGLSGSAKNLPDGRVEVVLHGPADAVAEVCGWLWEGSPASKVTAISVEDYAGEVAEGFATG